MQFEAIPEGSSTRLVETAFFPLTGFLGWLCWCRIYPLHSRIFSDLVHAIAARGIRHGLVACPWV